MATPERAVWPLPPRPPVLPLPEPMPRPTRMRSLLAPGLSRSSFKRAISIRPLVSSALPVAAERRLRANRRLFPVNDAHEVRQLVDHAADLGSVLERPLLADLIEAEPDQGRALVRLTAGGAGDLLDGYGLVSHLRLHRFLAATGLELGNLEA